jgi:hypothetical protein
MAAQVQDTSWGAIFPAALRKADRCIGANYTLSNEASGHRCGSGLCSVLIIVRPVTSLFRDIALDTRISPNLNTSGKALRSFTRRPRPLITIPRGSSPKRKSRACSSATANIKGRFRRA